MAQLLHSEDQGALSDNSPSPWRRAESAERFDILVRGIESKIQPMEGKSGDEGLFEAFTSFTQRGGSERDAVLTAFPLQNQLTQFTLRNPTNFADKRHPSLYHVLTPEAPPAQSVASSGVELGLGSGLDIFEVIVWQRPSDIHQELSLLWRSYLALSKGQYNNSDDEGLEDMDIGQTNFHVLREWCHLALTFGVKDATSPLFELLRSDIIGPSTGFRNFRHYVTKLLLTGIGTHMDAPLLMAAHAADTGSVWQSIGETSSLISKGEAGIEGPDTSEVTIQTRSLQCRNEIVLIARDASIRVNGKPHEQSNVANLYALREPSLGWEGTEFIEPVVSLPYLLSGYLWADPTVSVLGTLGQTKNAIAGSSSSTLQNSKVLAGLPQAFIERTPALWWQFTVANELWALRHGKGRLGESKNVNAKMRALLDVIYLLYLGTAVHGRSLLNRREQSAEEACLFSHFCGDGGGAVFASTAFSSNALFPSSQARTQQPLPSVRALYKLLIGLIHDCGATVLSGINVAVENTFVASTASMPTQTLHSEPQISKRYPFENDDSLQFDDDGEMTLLMEERDRDAFNRRLHASNNPSVTESDETPPSPDSVVPRAIIEASFKELRPEVLYRQLLTIDCGAVINNGRDIVLFDATRLAQAWFPFSADLPPSFVELLRKEENNSFADAMEEWAMLAERSVSNAVSKYTAFGEARTHMLSIFAATLDPYLALLSWILLGGGLACIAPSSGLGGTQNKLKVSITGFDCSVLSVTFHLSKTHSMQPRHVISVCRMLSAMGLTAEKVLEGVAAEDNVGEEFITVSIPMAATAASSDGDCLQQLWNQHIVPSATRELVKMMLLQPENLSLITDLTFGSVAVTSGGSHELSSPSHEAVRFVFRSELLRRGLGLGREDLNGSQHQPILPSLQGALVATGRHSSMPPIDLTRRQAKGPGQGSQGVVPMPEAAQRLARQAYQQKRGEAPQGRRPDSIPSQKDLFGFTANN
eukprot:GILJ01021369.1.p1 GENE.GILJ01021369.1~~GILJ01021369.1.p1  ORF type:complete len:986 (+),score=114.80 GILJ01021369.1:163-3120(+)